QSANLVDFERVRETARPATLAAVSHNCSADEMDRSLGTFGMSSPTTQIILTGGPEDVVAFWSDLTTLAEYHASELYQECCRHFEIEDWLGLAACAPGEPLLKCGAGFHFPRTGAVDARKRKLAKCLAPYVGKGLLAIGEWLEHWRRADALEEMADLGGEAVAAVARGRLLTATRAARALLGLDGTCSVRRSVLQDFLDLAPHATAAADSPAMMTAADGGRYRLQAVHAPHLGRKGTTLVRFVPVRMPTETFLGEMERAAVARGLSHREAQVFALMARSLTNYEIGASLGLSYHTVRAYLRRVYMKLGVSSRVQAVNAIRQVRIQAPSRQRPPP
ncbi:MAG: helix-turn-helix transcriptional regulator, partial [Planctomycetota bacterium]